MSFQDVKEQSIGAYISHIRDLRLEELHDLLQDILHNETHANNSEDTKFLGIQSHVDNVREFIYHPNHILGSEMTKHGEIAEKLDVLRRNCTRVLEGSETDAGFDNVKRTAPEDYIVANQAVQSKFHNGINKTLKAILDHNEKYEYFGSDGKSYYVIPKDQYNAITRILNGDKIVDINGQPLRLSTIQETKELVKLIEIRTSRPFSDVTKSSAFDYSESKLGNANQTLDTQEAQFKVQSEKNKQIIRDKAEYDKQIAQDQAKPSFSEATKIASIAAAFGGAASLGLSVYKKVKSGKKIENFTVQDWKDVGVGTGKGTIKGGFTGYSIYCLINVYRIPAPIASAYTAATLGVLNAANKYRKGEIDFNDFIEISQIICLDSSLCAIGAATGQVIIPIPILGAVVGSISTSLIFSIAKDYLSSQENVLIEQYQRDYEKTMLLLDEKYKAIYIDIIQKYEKFEDISLFAFDIEINNELHLQATLELAVEHGVEESRLLKNSVDIDYYFIY